MAKKEIVKYGKYRVYGVDSHFLAILVYVVPYIYFLTPLSEKLNLLVSCLVLSVGLIVGLIFRDSNLVKFHGIQSTLISLGFSLIIYVASTLVANVEFFQTGGFLTAYLVIHMTCMILVLFLPVNGIYRAKRCEESNIWIISDISRLIANKIR